MTNSNHRHNPGHHASLQQRGPTGTQVMAAQPAPSVVLGAAAPPVNAARQASPAQGTGVRLPDGSLAPSTLWGRHWPIPDQLLEGLPDLDLINPSPEPRSASVPFSGSASALEWLHYATKVHQQDKKAERTKKWLMAGGVTSLLVGFTSIFVYPLGTLMFGVAILLFIWRHRVSRLDIEDRRLEVLTGALTALAPEFKETKPVGVNLDFSAYTDHEAEAQGDAKTFIQHWLELRLPLRDGSHAAVRVTLQVKQKARVKRKYTKFKIRQIEEVCVCIGAPRNRAFGANRRAMALQGRPIRGLSLKNVAFQPKAATFTWTTRVVTNTRGRNGWTSSVHPQLNSRQLISAVVASYQFAASGECNAA